MLDGRTSRKVVLNKLVGELVLEPFAPVALDSGGSKNLGSMLGAFLPSKFWRRLTVGVIGDGRAWHCCSWAWMGGWEASGGSYLLGNVPKLERSRTFVCSVFVFDSFSILGSPS